MSTDIPEASDLHVYPRPCSPVYTASGLIISRSRVQVPAAPPLFVSTTAQTPAKHESCHPMHQVTRVGAHQRVGAHVFPFGRGPVTSEPFQPCRWEGQTTQGVQRSTPHKPVT